MNKNSYNVEVVSTNNQTVATITFNNGATFTGVATYHGGDNFDSEAGGKIARAKAWRSYWNFLKKNSVADSYDLEQAMNEKIDFACTCNKKVQALDEYILKLTKGEINE